MNILFVSAECYPFAKVGGLADVVGTLPQELISLGNDTRVILPNYKSIKKEFKDKMVKIAEFEVEVGWRKQYVGLLKLEYNNVIYYFIDNEYYFGARDRIYDFMDEGERFAYFQVAAIESMRYLDIKFDVIHVHDWHTAMIPHLLKSRYYLEFGHIKTVLTIHNVAYQGVFPKETMDLFNLPYEDICDFEGKLNFLKCGIAESDKVTTVSKTYAKELLYSYYGYGMQTILSERKKDLVGIVNGIDIKEFNPRTDKYISFHYNVKNYREGKEKNKEDLYNELGVDFFTDVPLIGIVSRLVAQKGLDLVKRIIEEILEEYRVKLVILGSGEKGLEDFFKELEAKYPYKVKLYIGYNEALAHKIYAASDIFLMPSKFEPCGIGQLIAMRYGTIPLVRETGGLKDTVKPFNEYTFEGTGFSFTNYNAHDMMYVLKYALRFYRQSDVWDVIVSSAMKSNFSFKKSAKAYLKLYNSIRK